MKKILMICLVLVMSMGVAVAQKPAKKAPKLYVTTVFVTNLDCPNCAKKVENNVPSLGKGIKDVKIDLPTREVLRKSGAYTHSRQAPIKKDKLRLLRNCFGGNLCRRGTFRGYSLGYCGYNYGTYGYYQYACYNLPRKIRIPSLEGLLKAEKSGKSSRISRKGYWT